MKLKHLYVATLIATLPTTSVFAAALERSNQSIQAFLEPGNYAEAGFKVVDHHTSPNLTNDIYSMVGRATTNNRNSIINQELGDITPTYLVPNLAIKTQINEKISLGLIYDEPFGLDTEFNKTRIYFSSEGNLTGSGRLIETYQGNSATSLKIDTKNITIPIGYHLNQNNTFIIAPVYQHLNGAINLYGTHYQSTYQPSYQYYTSKFNGDDAYGWLLGYAFNSDNNDLKTSITYRSKIKHKFGSSDHMHNDFLPYLGNKENTITTPQSVNINVSNKLTHNTKATAELRWVNWKNFEMYIDSYRVFNKSNNDLSSISPPTNTQQTTGSGATLTQAIGFPGGYDPISYNKDQWSLNLGLQHQLTDKWRIDGSLGWDSGVGKYISHYTPANESWNAGLGVKFSPASNYFVQTGISYTWYKNTKGQHAKQQAIDTSKYDVVFDDSYALTYDFKIGYRF